MTSGVNLLRRVSSAWDLLKSSWRASFFEWWFGRSRATQRRLKGICFTAAIMGIVIFAFPLYERTETVKSLSIGLSKPWFEFQDTRRENGVSTRASIHWLSVTLWSGVLGFILLKFLREVRRREKIAAVVAKSAEGEQIIPVRKEN